MKKSIDVERKVRDALARLQARRPQHTSLKSRAKAGVALVNITNVALEAGVSRTLIGHDGCSYPNLRKEVLQAASNQAKPKSTASLQAELRREIRFLKAQIEMKDTYVAELLLELERLGGRSPSESGGVVDFRSQRRQRRPGS